ncbi:DUF6115 domain-containing protein [Eubacterium xylanophilum]|uniref:DUF6115 domain-containing protein n=1 Tax=Eubacterium xylanophilum TaxID=39497 RepID=UPI00047E7ED5|nr:DUF6115 domain-containing protein [Eubacterium xylanophilum]
MLAIEIIILVLGFSFIGISFLVGRHNSYETVDEGEEPNSIQIWSHKEEELIKRQIDNILTISKEEVLLEADEILNKKSNDKIMQFDEFASEVMAKIENNHEEVVFMYSMLEDKEKSLKEIMAKTNQYGSTRTDNLQGQLEIELSSKGKKKSGKPEKKSKVSEDTVAEIIDPSEKSSRIKDRIIEAYKSGMSVMEISRELQIGQGEVKLLISLYCK